MVCPTSSCRGPSIWLTNVLSISDARTASSSAAAAVSASTGAASRSPVRSMRAPSSSSWSGDRAEPASTAGLSTSDARPWTTSEICRVVSNGPPIPGIAAAIRQLTESVASLARPA